MRSIGRKAVPYVALALGVAAVAWAVSLGTLPPADFTFCNGAEIKSVDPAIVTGAPEGRIIRAIFEGLVNWHPETLEPTPGVAERWEVSDDKLVHTFHLRENAVWSNGDPITAEDFRYTYRRFLDPYTPNQYSYQLWYVKNGEKYNVGPLEPDDPVEVELKEKPSGARPFARGKLLRGRLLAIATGTHLMTGSAEAPTESGDTTTEETSTDKADADKTEETKEDDSPKAYVVEIDGRTRRFRPGGGEGFEDCERVLFDFEAVGIKVIDPYTLQITLENPTPFFVKLTGFYPLFPVNAECVESYENTEWTKPERLVSNGPFRLQSRRIRDRIRLVKSDTYWNRDKVRLNVVDALAVESDATMLNMYLTGKSDWITTVSNTVIPKLREQGRKDFLPAPYFAVYFYRINVTEPPLDDVRVRRALSMAIDRREIIDAVTKVGESPAHSIVPPGVKGYERALCDSFDPEEAQRLLAEAGFPGGDGFPSVEILYNTLELHRDVAELIQSQWRSVLGINATLQNQAWGTYLNKQRMLDYKIARAAWIGDYVDPNSFLDMFVTEGANNETGWGNAEYDALIASAATEPDADERLRLLHRAERILMDEVPVIPTYFYVTKSMVRSYVRGFYGNMQDVHPLHEVWIDEAEKQRVFAAGGLR